MTEEIKTITAKLVELVRSRFHGSVTIHFANGVPKKFKTERTEDI